jgi:hypothetical protein
MGMPQSSRAYRIGPAADYGVANTLTNAVAYPSANGVKPDSLSGVLDEDGPATCTMLQGGHAATFGTATLQRQYSFDGTNFINDGAAISAATPVQVTLYRNLFYRWLVGGTGDITAAHLYIG